LKPGIKSDQALLQLCGSAIYTPVVTSFTEKTALALDLGQAEALALTLAAEEVFSYLCRVVPPDAGWIEIRSSSGGYYVGLDFIFPAADLDMRTFNITATLSLTDDADLDEMGLLLASRSVDRFQMEPAEGNRLRLTLIKEKAYPLLKEVPMPPVPAFAQFSVRSPKAGELKFFAELVHAHYRDQLIPAVFNYPGKLVDMVAGGEYQAVVAVNSAGTIGGGTFWHMRGTKAVECFGPYLFNQNPHSEMAAALLESCIGAIARSSAVVLINHFPTREFPREEFEYLGKAPTYKQDGTIFYHEAWARLLQEDLGCVVWAHPQLYGFLRKEYARLVLPREIRIMADQGERHSPHSVLLSTFNRPQGSVTLQPIWTGEDFEENLSRHKEVFRKERILNVYFTMDLGRSWEAEFAPSLLRNGFTPYVILPYAGAGDLLIFQVEEACS
jgi:hypothetical protein